MAINEIILNRMYAGKFLLNNIGHEIINLFKADNGNNYIYINPYGTMAKGHDSNNIKAVLLVRYTGDNTMEILAKATDLEQILSYSSDKDDHVHKQQIKYIDDNNITYNGVKLYKILKDNPGNEVAIYFTFKANTLLKPIKPISIRDDDLSDYNFSKQSLKMYVNEKKNPNAYKHFESIINDDSLWEKNNTTQQIIILDDNSATTNFLKIIGKENEETVFSNLFKYYFNLNKEAFCKFANDVLKCNINDNFDIKREYACTNIGNQVTDGYIDLLVNDNKNIIVIENKIKSGINGVKERHDIRSDAVQSQLEVYYNYTAQKFDKHRKNFYIFVPDYNYNHIQAGTYKCQEHYSLITYSEIRDWFLKNCAYYYGDKYFVDFISALTKHTKPVDNALEEEMYMKFYEAIKEAKG